MTFIPLSNNIFSCFKSQCTIGGSFICNLIAPLHLHFLLLILKQLFEWWHFCLNKALSCFNFFFVFKTSFSGLISKSIWFSCFSFNSFFPNHNFFSCCHFCLFKNFLEIYFHYIFPGINETSSKQSFFCIYFFDLLNMMSFDFFPKSLFWIFTEIPMNIAVQFSKAFKVWSP